MTSLLLTALVAIFATEVFGYFLHRLLHSDRIHWLSHNHMVHHLQLYGPKMKQRSDAYLESTEGRAGVAGLGAEWIVPAALYVGVLLGVGALLTVAPTTQAVFIGTSLVWSYLAFWRLHDIMHIRGHWLMKRPWFRRARRLHDIHHLRVTDDGLMDCNFGIYSFFMDRLFGTYRPQLGQANERGYEAALQRYTFINK